MKKLSLISMLAIFGSVSGYAAQNCGALAAVAAKYIYSLNSEAPPVTQSNVAVNPNNTGNGVSLVVTLNETKYLVFLTPASPDPTGLCTSVDYVIAFPYANLIRQ